MKRVFYFKAGTVAFFTILVCVQSYGSVTIRKLDNATTYDFKVSDIAFEKVELNEVNYLKPVLKGLDGYDGVLFKVGQPELPVIRFFIDGNGPISIKPGAEKIVKLSKTPIKPSVLSVPKCPGLRPDFAIDSVSYSAKSFRPGAAYQVKAMGTVSGKLRQMVTLFPVRYNPTENSLQTISQFQVTVQRGSERERSSVGKAVAFIVGEKFLKSSAVQQYQAFKEKEGFVVKTISVAAGMTPEMIRAQLITHFNDSSAPINHAIIFGDNDAVPGSGSQYLSGVTDHYYRCLDTADYDKDIGTPDIAIGRIAVQTEQELAAVVSKHLKYVRSDFKSKSWYRQLSFLASDDPYFWQVAEGTHNYAIDTYTAPLGYLGEFPEANQPGGDRLYAITHKVSDATVLEKMKAGRALINYGGHGSIESWAAPAVNKDDVLSMKHPDALPVVISNACLTGHFIDDSFAETWQRHPHGSIMFWGSMDSTYWDEDDILERRMYDALYRDNKKQFSAFTDFALQEVWRYYGGEGRSKYYWETYVLFGDPLMSLHTKNEQ